MSSFQHSIDTSPTVTTNLDIQINSDNLSGKIRTSSGSSSRAGILETGKRTLENVNGIWRPAFTYRWLSVNCGETEDSETILGNGDNTISLHLGHSSSFFKEAEFALAAIYTAGVEIEREAQIAVDNQDMLVSYMIDMIGLLVLEKTCDLIKQVAEEKAKALGFGVSPFLSPGSVHGWDLEEQAELCSILPIGDIGVSIDDHDAVLHPYKSLTCLIGIGKGYTSHQVGTTCQVCSRNQNCEMKDLH